MTILSLALSAAPAPAAPQDSLPAAAVGEAAPDFELRDSDGATVRLSDHLGKIVVLQWVNPDCPVCERVTTTGLVVKMLDEIKKISEDVVHLPISTTHTMKIEPVLKYLQDNKIEAKPLLDADGTVGRLYEAKTTPHMYVIDAEGVLRYSGAIDDDPKGRKEGGVTNYVVNAVRRIVAGEEVSPSTTKPYGCSVKFKN